MGYGRGHGRRAGDGTERGWVNGMGLGRWIYADAIGVWRGDGYVERISGCAEELGVGKGPGGKEGN